MVGHARKHTRFGRRLVAVSRGAQCSSPFRLRILIPIRTYYSPVNRKTKTGFARNKHKSFETWQKVSSGDPD